MVSDPLTVALEFAAILVRLDVPYVVGGSVASTIHGEPRMTMDVDFAVQLRSDQVDALHATLIDAFHVSREAIERATTSSTSFSAIHLGTLMKADVYVRPPTGLFASEIERAVPVRLGDGSAAELRVATPEDTLLQKLRWYREGGGTSDKQWRDVLGILRAAGDTLDTTYLDHWAAELGLGEDLARAIRQAGGG